MFRKLHAYGACFAAIASVFTLGLCAAPAEAAAACDQRVLTDWSDNGRIDGIYPLGCYEEAIDALPVDLRDYTNAEQIIGRALTTALRRSPAGEPSSDGQSQAAADTTASDGSSLPLPLVVAAGAALALLAGGALAYASRRRGTAN